MNEFLKMDYYEQHIELFDEYSTGFTTDTTFIVSKNAREELQDFGALLSIFSRLSKTTRDSTLREVIEKENQIQQDIRYFEVKIKGRMDNIVIALHYSDFGLDDDGTLNLNIDWKYYRLHEYEKGDACPLILKIMILHDAFQKLLPEDKRRYFRVNGGLMKK